MNFSYKFARFSQYLTRLLSVVVDVTVYAAVHVELISVCIQKTTTFSAAMLSFISNPKPAEKRLDYLISQLSALIIASANLLPVIVKNPTSMSKA